MYYVYVTSGPSLLIESTDSMICTICIIILMVNCQCYSNVASNMYKVHRSVCMVNCYACSAILMLLVLLIII